jgi:uncharacterized YigZ family protein
MPDTYRTLADDAQAEMKVDGSRFLAEAMRVGDREAAEAEIDAIREREHAATHHCSAYRLGTGGDTFRYDDDGEPSGTAGPPILRQIDGRDLTNTLVVVTRYYGGTKLGTGGLARAYGDAAAQALDRAGVDEQVVRVRVRLRYAYDDTTPAERVLRQFDAEEVEATYTDVTEKVVAVPASRTDAFRTAFRNALGARGEAETLDS